MRNSPFLLLLFFLCSWQMAHAIQPESELEQTTTFTVRESGSSGYELSSQTDVTRKCLVKRGGGISAVSVAEQYFDQITDFDVRIDDRSLPRSSFTSEYSTGEDIFISDFRIHFARLPRSLDTGQSVMYSVRRNYSSIAFLPIVTIPNSDYIRSLRVVIEHPDDLRVDFDFYFPFGTLAYTVEHPEPGVTTLQFRNVEQRDEMPGFPFNDLLGAVQIRLKKGTVGINPTTIEEFTRWYHGMFDQKPQLAPKFDTLLSSRLAGVSTPIEKLRVIHDFVRGTIRYIAEEQSIHAYVPRDPSLVLERGYGDCKDRAYLVATLARRHGIKVNMALVSTSPRPSFDGTHVSQFNHVICAYRDGGRTIFFDPTSRYCEFGNLPEGDIGAEALILDPVRPERMLVTPPNRAPSISVAVTAKIDKLKEASATVVLRNDFFGSALAARERKSGLELENIISNLVTSQFQKISFDYFEFQSQDDSSITFRAKADIADFLIASTSKKYLPHMPFRIADAELLERAKDTLPIYVPWRDRASMTIDLEATGYRAEPASEAFGDETTARFDAAITSAAPGRLQFSYNLSQQAKWLQGDARRRFLEYSRASLKSKKNMFVLTRTE